MNSKRAVRGGTRAVCVVAVLLAVAPISIAAQAGVSVGDRILANESLFSAALVKTFDLEPTKEPDSMTKAWHAVPDGQRPRLADIEKKYGKAARVIDETAPALRSGSVITVSKSEPDPGLVPKRTVTVHYYGLIGFGIDKAAGNEAVIVITNLHVSAAGK